MSTQLSNLPGRHGTPDGYASRHIGRPKAAHRLDDSNDQGALTELGSRMVGAGPNDPLDREENKDIAAGYTYFGQFISHDLSFNPVNDFPPQVDNDAIRNARTPSLDLDSIYGQGPIEQSYLYVDDEKFLLGERLTDDGDPENIGYELPRQATDRPWPHPSRAIIADPRNDENNIVGQIHSVFLQFHNRMVDQVPSDQKDRFEVARQETRWHYQWIVLHDFLPKIVPEEILQSIVDLKALSRGEIPTVPIYELYEPAAEPWIPVEFAFAAYRFGHSMVRPHYHINKGVREAREAADKGALPILSDPTEDSLLGRRRMKNKWAFDWDFFFPKEGGAVIQPSLRIDTLISKPLFELQRSTVVKHGESRLSVLTLLRGAQMRLPSGETVARLLGRTPLTSSELYDRQVRGEHAARGIDGLSQKTREMLRNRTPLWYYVLREAELEAQGKRLGPVGGRIVAETLIGLLFSDRESVVNAERRWRPIRTPWGMRDLIEETKGTVR